MNHVIWRGIFITLFFLAIQVFLFGQECGVTIETPEIIFYIKKISFDIKGQTRLSALLSLIDIKEGEQIRGQNKLKTYISDKQQLLINQRALASVNIEYTTGDVEADGRVPLELLIHTEDTWNLIALPYPKYDTNEGFSLTLKMRDYNFFGTLMPLRIDLGYRYNDVDETNPGYKQSSFNIAIDSDTPFEAFGFKWNFDFDHVFSYTFDEPLYYKNTTGISMDVPFSWTTLTFGFAQNFIVNEENDEIYKDDRVNEEGEILEKGYGEFTSFYMSSELYASWRIPLGITVWRFGTLSYTPRLSGTFSYLPEGELTPARKGPSLTLSQSLGFGRINWKENYRSGLEAYIENANTLNIYTLKWSNNYSITATGHIPLTSFFGVSSKLRFQQWFFDEEVQPENSGMGNILRGIKDSSLFVNTAGYMLSLNLDLPFQVLRFVPSEWFNWWKTRLFNFDLHVSPIIDMALLRGGWVTERDNGVVLESNLLKFSPADLLVTGGLELVVFPHAMRSFYIRFSLGLDLRELATSGSLPGGEHREIFLGVGHYY